MRKEGREGERREGERHGKKEGRGGRNRDNWLL